MNGYQKIDFSQVGDCIKQTSNFGETIYYNICNGATHIVPWGGVDWAFVCVPITILSIIAIVIWLHNSY